MPSVDSESLVTRLLQGGSQRERDRELAELVERRFKRGEQLRAPFVKDWRANLQFYAGNHWIAWDHDSGAFKLRAHDTPTWAVRTTENRFLRLMQATLALLLGQRTEYQVIPSGTSPEDRIAAELGNKIAEQSWDIFDLEATREEAALWMLLTGIVGIDTHWDPDAGPLAPIVETVLVRGEDGEEAEEPVMGANNEPEVKRDGRGNVIWSHLGDVRHVIMPPTHFIPDEYATRPKDLTWYIYHCARPLRYIVDRWPETGADVVPDDVGEDTFGSYAPQSYQGERGHQSQDPNNEEPGAIVKQMVVAPSADFPIGGTAWVANTILLEFDEGLDEHCLKNAKKRGGLGLHMARCYPVPDRFWPASAGDQQRPLQKRLNVARSQVYEAINQTVGGKWLVPRSANISPGSLNRRPAERVLYDAPFPPLFEQPKPIPRYIVDVMNAIPQWMQELNQTHQATLGQAPRNLRSGLAIAEVQEQDEVGWSIPSRELDRCFAGLMGRTLYLVQNNYDEERRLESFDEQTGEWDVQHFAGADLTGIADVRVVQGSSMRKSKTQQQAYLLELMQSQVGVMMITEYPEFLSRLMEALGLGHFGTVFTASKSDASEARREIWILTQANRQMQAEMAEFLQMMSEGAADGAVVEPPAFLPMVDTYQNQQVHLREHGDWLKDPRSHENPVIRAVVAYHFNAHFATFASQMMAATAEDSPEDGAKSKAS